MKNCEMESMGLTDGLDLLYIFSILLYFLKLDLFVYIYSQENIENNIIQRYDIDILLHLVYILLKSS